MVTRAGPFPAPPQAPTLVGLAGIGLIGAGIFVTDPLNGYPPGTPLIPIRRTAHGSAEVDEAERQCAGFFALPPRLGQALKSNQCGGRHRSLSGDSQQHHSIRRDVTRRIIERTGAFAWAALTRFSSGKSQSARNRFQGRIAQYLSAVSRSTTSQ